MAAVPMNRATIETALGAWFATITGLEPRWRERSQSFGGTWNATRTGSPVGAHGELFLKVSRSVGVDRLYFEHDADADLGEEIIPHVMGARVLLWDVQVVSNSQEADADAESYCERVRDLIRSHSAKTAFAAVGIGVIDAGDVRDLTYTVNGRRTSRAVVEIRFNAFVDVEDIAFGYVEQFEITSDLKDPSGNSLPAAYQIDGELIPEEVP